MKSLLISVEVSDCCEGRYCNHADGRCRFLDDKMGHCRLFDKALNVIPPGGKNHDKHFGENVSTVYRCYECVGAEVVEHHFFGKK